MNEPLAAELIALRERDLTMRAELASDGSLLDGYHPRMEVVHRANAARLREIIAEHGWPGTPLVGVRGAEAAFLIAQHAIGEPPFMRRCRELLAAAVAAGAAPAWQLAYLDDRINVFEDRPQHYGTQLRPGANGRLEPCPLAEPDTSNNCAATSACRRSRRSWRKRNPIRRARATQPRRPPPSSSGDARSAG